MRISAYVDEDPLCLPSAVCLFLSRTDEPLVREIRAAVEAEFVFRIGADAPADKTDYTAQEAADLVEALLVGVELAGSPLPLINVLGPPIVVSDFGNNTGLILGPEVRGWRALAAEELAGELIRRQRPDGSWHRYYLADYGLAQPQHEPSS